MPGPAWREARQDVAAWLGRKVRAGELLALPTYRPAVGGPSRPDRFARGLLAALDPAAAVSSSDRGAVVTRAIAFRAWVEAQPRPPIRPRQSPIDLDHCPFGALRTTDQIHEALRNIAHPEPGRGPPFRPSAPRRKGRRRIRARASGLIPAEFRPYEPILILVLLSLAMTGWLVTRRHTPDLVSTLLGLGILLGTLPILYAVARAKQHSRGAPVAARPDASRTRGPLHDRWLDDQPKTS